MTTETLMTEAATTTEGAASEQTTETSATGADGGGQQQQATEGQGTEGQQAEGAQTETKTEQVAGAPEKYEFVAPEGHEFDTASITAFSEVAKDLNLPQEAAQKILDKVTPVLAERQAEAIEALSSEWAEASRADKEFGGEKLEENLALVQKARDEFASPELRELLEKTKLGNNPEVVRLFYRVGKAISEDRFVGGRQGETPPTVAQRMYPNMNP